MTGPSVLRSSYGPDTLQTIAGPLRLEDATPRLSLFEPDAAADNRRWDILVNTEELLFRTFNDAGTLGVTWLQVQRTLNAIDLIFLNGPVQVGTFGANGTAPIARPSVTGSRGANAALASLLTALDSYGLITDNTVI